MIHASGNSAGMDNGTWLALEGVASAQLRRRSMRGTRRGWYAVVAAASVMWWSGGAMAAPPPHPPKPTPAQQCEAKKNEAAGEKADCLANERAKEVKGKTPNFAKCEADFAKAFAKAEKDAGPGGCTTEGDTAAIESRVDACMAGVAAALAGDNCPDDPAKTEPGICGCGYAELPNTNCPGCTLCLQSGPGPVPGCSIQCVGPPACVCAGVPPGEPNTCCTDNPCCDNCPDPKPLQCFTNSCTCDPEACCFLVPAP
jgi:hypothetical protein